MTTADPAPRTMPDSGVGRQRQQVAYYCVAVAETPGRLGYSLPSKAGIRAIPRVALLRQCP